MQKQIEQTLTSLEVAEMIGKEHKNLLRDIDRYCNQLNKLKIELVDFFQESTYIDGKGEERPCYKITKKGCEFVVHKLTGIKGTEFTIKYINRFHNMEEAIKEFSKQTEKQEKEVVREEQNPSKPDRTEIMLMNARTRQADLYYKLSQVETLSPTYKSILVAKAAETLSGESILPLQKVERKTYSAEEIGKKFGISANKVGRIANKHNLKIEKYGEYQRDKSKYSAKEVDVWMYYDTVIPVIAKILDTEVA